MTLYNNRQDKKNHNHDIDLEHTKNFKPNHCGPSSVEESTTHPRYFSYF